MSRADARALLEAGKVTVGGTVVPKPTTLVDRGDPIAIDETDAAARFASRAGSKLDGVLDLLDVRVAGLRCLDVGASTGGFTDVLLRRGAASVVCVDVGPGQLSWALRNDERVTVRERTDVRHVDRASAGEPDLVVVDVSFISLRTLMPKLSELTADGDLLVLCKPQFEVGRRRYGTGGVVEDPTLIEAAVDGVVRAAEAAGLVRLGSAASPVRGTSGNQELFVHLRGRQ